jgi:hypothetical protein
MIKIFSLRTEDGTPNWTIEYDITTRTIKQFHGLNDVKVDSKSENQELVIQTLSTLYDSTFPVDLIDDTLNYSILRDGK